MRILLMIIFILVSKLTEDKESIPEQFTDTTQNKLPCPTCGSFHTIKNGSTHNGKPKSKCKNCGRQFVVNPNNKTISSDTKSLIDKLLLERISLRGIVRSTGVSFA
jgi:transposase-like protein